jgi:hypothetical protein
MANISTVSTPIGRSTGHANPARKPGVFRKILEAIMESRRRKAEIEIAEIIGRRGGIPPRRP